MIKLPYERWIGSKAVGVAKLVESMIVRSLHISKVGMLSLSITN